RETHRCLCPRRESAVDVAERPLPRDERHVHGDGPCHRYPCARAGRTSPSDPRSAETGRLHSATAAETAAAQEDAPVSRSDRRAARLPPTEIVTSAPERARRPVEAHCG